MKLNSILHLRDTRFCIRTAISVSVIYNWRKKDSTAEHLNEESVTFNIRFLKTYTIPKCMNYVQNDI